MKKNLLFKLCNEEKRSKIEYALNPNFDEEGYRLWECSVVSTYDDYVIFCNYKENKYYKQTYAFNEQDELTFGDKEEVFFVVVTEEEKQLLENIQAGEGISAFASAKEEAISQIAEKDSSITKLNEDITALNATNATLNGTVEELNATVATLTTYKESQELAAKETLIGEFEDKLDKSTLEEFKANINTYALEDLEKDLAVKVLRGGKFDFEKHNYIPKPQVDALTPMQLEIKEYLENKNK